MKIEHRFKFCFDLQDSIIETFNKLMQVYRDQVLWSFSQEAAWAELLSRTRDINKTWMGLVKLSFD